VKDLYSGLRCPDLLTDEPFSMHYAVAAYANMVYRTSCDSDNSQNRYEDAASYCGAERPDGHDEVDEERGETDVVVEDVVSVS